MKTLIVARTSRGKDYLRELLEINYGWKFVKSRTTRKPRFDGEDTHIFISREEAENTPETNIIAKTEINGDIYFATKEDLANADAYIIDPNGVEYLCDKCPEEWFQIVYIKASSDEAAEKAALERAQKSDNPEAEMEVYHKRCEAEDDQFTQFEAIIENQSFKKECCCGINVLENDYDAETMLNHTMTLEMRRRFYENMKPVLQTLKQEEFIDGDEKTVSLYHQESNEQIRIRNEHFIQLLAEEQKKSMFSDIMESYLFRPTNDSNKMRTENTDSANSKE